MYSLCRCGEVNVWNAKWFSLRTANGVPFPSFTTFKPIRTHAGHFTPPCNILSKTVTGLTLRRRQFPLVTSLRDLTITARPNDKCWKTENVGWTNILSFGHRVWWPLNMLDDAGTCLMQYQTFDPTSSNISFVLMLDAWNFVRLAGLNNMLHARTRIRTANRHRLLAPV